MLVASRALFLAVEGTAVKGKRPPWIFECAADVTRVVCLSEIGVALLHELYPHQMVDDSQKNEKRLRARASEVLVYARLSSIAGLVHSPAPPTPPTPLPRPLMTHTCAGHRLHRGREVPLMAGRRLRDARQPFEEGMVMHRWQRDTTKQQCFPGTTRGREGGERQRERRGGGDREEEREKGRERTVYSSILQHHDEKKRKSDGAVYVLQCPRE